MSAIILLVLAATPIGGDTPASLSRPPTAQCEAARAVPVTRTRLGRSAEWSVRQVTDLRFETRLRPGVDARTIEFRIYTPNGHLYRKLDAAPRRDASDHSEGIRRRPREDARAVLPVSGTGIVRNGLYGKWTAVPYLAGESQPCGRPVSFSLVP